MLLGVLPADGPGITVSGAEESGHTAVVEAKEFASIPEQAEQLAQQGGTRSSGGWRYVRIPDTKYAAVVGYEGDHPAELEMPDLLGGLDVVAVGPNALADLKDLETLTIPGNVRAIGSGALPRGTSVKSLHGAYALTWAARNGHAGISTSEYEFHEGVIDLSDVREENFVRVSANEVWLRGLEASRLAVGSRFFLMDPGNAYQISYYEVQSMIEGLAGFVVFRCETPDVDEVLDYYEAVNQTMAADLSTLEMFDGITLDKETAARSLSVSQIFPLKSVLTSIRRRLNWVILAI